MNDGKSQTWLYYATTILETLGAQYVAKSDTDSVLFVDRALEFFHTLPLHPHNVLCGSVADKLWWSNLNPHKEAYFVQKYGRNLHLYVQGQFYLMSLDLARTVVHEARDPHNRALYEGHEDHDISTLAFRSEQPIHLIVLALEQRFWKHRVKLKLGFNWHRIWDEEISRLQQVVAATQSKTAS